MKTRTETSWEPVWALPNLELDQAIDGGEFALVPPTDIRVERISEENEKFRIYVNRFQDAHGQPIQPALILRRQDVPNRFKTVNAVSSFRDLIAASTVPLARSLDLIFDNAGDRVRHSSAFWVYPWMLGKDNRFMIASTPDTLAIHTIDEFRGQSSPEISRVTLRRETIDEPLFEELCRRWKIRYGSRNPEWPEIALFRSLHMAYHACLIPAGADAVFHDYGRVIALWAAAFEILAHPGHGGKANARKVLQLLEAVPWIDKACGHKRSIVGVDSNGVPVRKNIACWLYGHINRCRNDFLHGNPVGSKSLQVPASGRLLTTVAASLYRLALTSFLKLVWQKPIPADEEAAVLVKYSDQRWRFWYPQRQCEEALRLSRISVGKQRSNRERKLKEASATSRRIALQYQRSQG